MSRYLIYGLIDPRTGELRYVGKTRQRLNKRLALHRQDALETDKAGRWEDITHRANWLRTLYARGLAPEVEVLESHDDGSITNDAERFWIEYLRFLGCRLTNMTDGGDGGVVSRRPSCTDEQVLRLYIKGVSTPQIARTMKTCKKRVCAVLRKNGIHPRGTSRPVVDELGTRFETISEAAKAYGVSIGAISNVLCGKAKTSAGGHYFRYVK